MKREQPAGLENAVGLPPAGGQQALVEGVGSSGWRARLATTSSALGVWSAEKRLGVAILQREPQPDVEEVGEFGVVQQAAERRIGDDQIVRAVFDGGEVGRRGRTPKRPCADRIGRECASRSCRSVLVPEPAPDGASRALQPPPTGLGPL